MTHYLAVFPSGAMKEIKNSRRAYTHAWSFDYTVSYPGGARRTGTKMGFAKSASYAERAAVAEIGFIRRVLHSGAEADVTSPVIVPVQIVA